MFVHPSAEVRSDRIGEGTRIWQGVVVLPGATIGRNCNINAHCLVEDGVVVGDNVTLKCGVYLWNGVTLESDVFVGPNATFTNDPTPRSQRRPAAWTPTLVKRGASIGAHATLLCGITVGEYAMVGAGSVVTKDVPAYALVFGNPAMPRGHVCACGTRLNAALRCPGCAAAYAAAADGALVPVR